MLTNFRAAISLKYIVVHKSSHFSATHTTQVVQCVSCVRYDAFGFKVDHFIHQHVCKMEEKNRYLVALKTELLHQTSIQLSPVKYSACRMLISQSNE